MRLSRGVALAILLGLLGALWLGPVAAYVHLVGAGNERVAAAESKLARLRALAATPANAGAAVDPQTVFLPEKSDAETVALLQETLKGAAAAAQVEIEGIQVLPAEPLSGVRRIAVRLRGRGDMSGLDRLLYAIEAARPVLYPDHLQLLARAQQQAAAPTMLNFQIDVSGFKQGGPT